MELALMRVLTTGTLILHLGKANGLVADRFTFCGLSRKGWMPFTPRGWKWYQLDYTASLCTDCIVAFVEAER